MRKNKMMRFASGLLVATLLTTSIISGTFAKYTSNASATDSANVAKWSFTVGGQDIAKKEAITFDLFNTVKEENTTTTEEHIQTKDGTIIAPGTGGSFDIVLENKSEVTAKYAIDFTETNTSNPAIPIEYSTDGSTWKSDINELDITADDTKTALTYNGGKTTITVYWRWAYEAANTPARNQTDANDTTLGVNGGTVKVEAEITATQVD